MKNTIPSLLVSLLLCASAHAQFAYHPSVPGPDGPTAAFVTFKAGNREVKYCPPVHWERFVDHFRPEKYDLAEASIVTSAIDAATPWTEDHIKQVREAVLSRMVPQGVTKLEVVSEEASPLKICGQETYEITFSCVAYGMEYETSVLFVEKEHTQLRFVLSTRKKDFADLHQVFRGSLFSVDGF
jgi:hypothetical protein